MRKVTTKVEDLVYEGEKKKKKRKEQRQTNSNNKNTRKAILVESKPKWTGDILNPVKVSTATCGNR